MKPHEVGKRLEKEMRVNGVVAEVEVDGEGDHEREEL